MLTDQFIKNKKTTGFLILTKASLALFGLILSPAVFGQIDLTQLDGNISQDEMSEMKMIGNIDPAEFYIGKNGDVLILSIRSEPIHVASVCIAQNESVTVYHASAALGAIKYTPLNNNWETKEEFQWEMRNGEMTLEAIEQRQTYFEEHKWIASTTKMGRSGNTEFYFDTNAFDSESVYLAAGLMLVSDPDSIVSFPELNASACSDHSLVAGSPDAQYSFDPSSWLEISP